MYRLFPCIPIFIFWGGGGVAGGGLIKSAKRMCIYVYMIMLFLVLIIFKVYFLMCKKGISR